VGRPADSVQSSDPGPGGGEAVRRALVGGPRQDQSTQLCTVRGGVSRRTAQRSLPSGMVIYLYHTDK
jgi:hypothetical protein